MFVRLAVLVGWLVTASSVADAQSSPAPASAPAAQADPSAAPPVDETAIPDALPSDELEQQGPAPEEPPGGLDATPAPPPSSGLGVNLAAPDLATSGPAKRDLESDPLFLPSVLLMGGGGAVLLASLFTGLGAHGVYNQLERDCKNDVCPAGSQQKIDNGSTLAIISTVLTFVGVAAAGTGAGLMIVAANRQGEPEQARLRLTPGPTPLGMGASASF